MQTRKIIPKRNFDSTAQGSFIKGQARDVPTNYAKHFVDAGVAEYADAEPTLSDLAAGVLARAGIASGQDQAQNATNDQVATEVTGEAEKPASGPEIASGGEVAIGAALVGEAAEDQGDRVVAGDQVDQATGQADQVDQVAAGQAAPADQAAPAAPKKRKTAAKEA